MVKIMEAEVPVERRCPLIDSVDNHSSSAELSPPSHAATKRID